MTAVDRLVERGESLDSLSARTNELDMSSTRFQRGSRALSARLWWNLIKQNIAMIGLVIFALYLFFAMFCGVDLSC